MGVLTSIFGGVLLLVSLPSLAEYEPGRIKQAITEASDMFQVASWKRSDNGEAWIANSGAAGVVLSVGKHSAGIISSLANAEQGQAALLRCLTLGSIGLAPGTTQERKEVTDTVLVGTQGQAAKVTLNGVLFEVTAREIGGAVWLSCLLSPSQ